MSLWDRFYDSSNWVTVVLALAICLAVYVFFQWSQMPPGPMGLPYLGCYPLLSEDSHVQLLKMSEDYGKVFCFRYTGQMYAHIRDLKTIREINLTKSDCFGARPTTFTLFKDIFGDGVLLLNGEEWKILRKFFVKEFKELGMGKQAQEGVVHDCLKKIVRTLNGSNGKNVDGLKFFAGISNDVIRHMIFGGVTIDEKDIKDFNSAYITATEFTVGARILLAGPFLKYILMHFGSEFRHYRKYKEQVDAIVTKIIRQHEREFDKNNIRNLVDGYINQRKQLEERKDPTAKFFTERYLVPSVIQFFGDGTLGVAWLSAAILKALSSRPDIQKVIQTELDEVVGRERFPSMDDRSRLSYTLATIYEGQRTVLLFPLLPLVECTKETTLGGCRIPKGTIPVYNIWAAFHDRQVYDNPDKFDPTRFLSVDGKKARNELPILFGVGKRACIGESFSTMQILLYVATVLQNYNVHPADETENKELNITFRVTPRSS